MRLFAAARLRPRAARGRRAPPRAASARRSRRAGSSREHGLDLVRGVAVLAQVAARSRSSMKRDCASVSAALRATAAALVSSAQLERAASLLDEDAHDAERGAPQPERILVAGRAAGRCRRCRPASSSLSASATAHARVAHGQPIAGEARPVVLLDGAATTAARRRPRVVAAHHALQLGEFAHHAGQEVGLGEQRGALRVATRVSPRGSARCAPARQLQALDALELACRACCGRRSRRAAARDSRRLSCGPGRRRSARRRAAAAPRARCRRRCARGSARRMLLTMRKRFG